MRLVARVEVRSQSTSLSIGTMSKLERLDRYTEQMARLQHIWAYLLKRKMRLYRS